MVIIIAMESLYFVTHNLTKTMTRNPIETKNEQISTEVL